MLSGVLRSERAIQVNVAIMRAFGLFDPFCVLSPPLRLCVIIRAFDGSLVAEYTAMGCKIHPTAIEKDYAPDQRPDLSKGWN